MKIVWAFITLIHISCSPQLLVTSNVASSGGGASEIYALSRSIAAEGDQVEVSGINFSQGLYGDIEGENVPLTVSTTNRASFIMPKIDSNVSAKLSFYSADKILIGSFSIRSSDLIVNPPLFDGSRDQICSDVSFVNPEGKLLSGSRDCGPQLKHCDLDGETDCVVVKPGFAAAELKEAKEKIVMGQRLGGVEGIANSSSYSNCTGPNQTGCIADSTYPTMDLSQPSTYTSLSTSNFNSSVSTNASFRFWDITGRQQTVAGEAQLQPSNLRTGVTVFGKMGVMPDSLPQAPSIVTALFHSTPSNQVVLRWASTGAQSYLVVARQGSAPTFVPTRNLAYSVGPQGSDTILSIDSALSFTHTPVNPGSTYHYAVYGMDSNNFYSSVAAHTSNDTILCSGLVGGSWVAVPGSLEYGTSDFCVMKYEAKNIATAPKSQAAQVPWNNISQTDARTACQTLGTSYDLISNNEWLTLSSNIASEPSNWSGGSVGSGFINRGHSDNVPSSACAAAANDSDVYLPTNCASPASTPGSGPEQKRTHTLTTGAIIWDVSGNIAEWTSYLLADTSKKPYVTADTGPVASFVEFSALDNGFSILNQDRLTARAPASSTWNNAWGSTQGIGQYYAGVTNTGGALSRGGKWNENAGAGIFTINLGSIPTQTTPNIGFRCVFRL